jgi:PP-loop superfamily ATP-utilizing enzyme
VSVIQLVAKETTVEWKMSSVANVLLQRSLPGRMKIFDNFICRSFSKSSSHNAAGGVHVSKTTKDSNIPSTAPFDGDKVDATILVDSLLEYTRTLMTGKSDGKDADFASHKSGSSSSHSPSIPHHHIVAFSGGIDSSVVTALVHQVASFRGFSNHTGVQNHTVTAALGISPAVPKDQILLAEQVAHHIGVDLHHIETTEGNDSMYIANEGKACLACKTHLYTCLSSIAGHYDRGGVLEMQQSAPPPIPTHYQLYNGTNADDWHDPTRLGLIAANNYHVKSPLEKTPKALVRIAGRHLGLPNWNHAASPCLRSRLALGVEAIPQHLQTIESAERFVRSTLELDPTHNMRVRLLAGNKAMIEVDESLLERARASVELDDVWTTTFVNTLGFASLDVRAFQTGSVAKK